MMKKHVFSLMCGLLYPVLMNANDPKPPVIIGKEHALSERMLSPQKQRSILSFFQKNESQASVIESFSLGDGISVICEANDPSGTLLEVTVSAEHWSELIFEIDFIPRLKEISKLVYSKLNDDFDFVIYVLNTPIDEEIKNQLGFYGLNSRVSNSVEGLGMGKHDFTSEWGSQGKLRSSLYFPYYDAISAGPSLHEFLHTWMAFICPTYDLGTEFYLAHWGMSNANGQAGGFQNVRIVEENCNGVEGKTLYQANRDPDGSFENGGFGVNANDGNSTPYSDIELYLMGLKSAEELRDANFYLDIYSGNDYQAESFANGYFYSTGKKTYTIDDIIARNGERIPDASLSQKQFKVLAVVLTPETAISNYTNEIMRDIVWLAGEMNDATYPGLYNFRQATDNRGSLIVNNLISSINKKGEIQTTDNSYFIVADTYVYPNPTNGMITLKYDVQTNYRITITDSRGQILMLRIVSEPITQLDLNKFPAGMYLLTIEDDLQKITKKIIKNR